MANAPEFEDRGLKGASGPHPATYDLKTVEASPGMTVMLCYRGKSVFVKITEVVEQRAKYIGTVSYFSDNTLKHEDLKAGDVVEVPHGKIERFILDST